MLVREVHHRIKNHLQGMVGLLSLYSYKSPDEKNLIQDIAAKITSVAVVYGVQGKNSQDHAFLCEITSEICRSLQNFGKKQNRINYSINVDHRALLPSEYAVPMALIINELMINAIKHSTDLAVKSVQVNLFIGENSAILTIQNDSPELSSFPDFEQEIGLGVGLSLVRAMLPKTGVCLSLTQHQDIVRASLSIKSPIISII
ncbi:MAG: histidine kinase dimerization/phosphoacceptor domain -containing protein [Methylococcales bacterium]